MNAARLVWRATGAWAARVLRVSAATGVVVAAFGAVAVRASYAHAADVGMNFGDELRLMSEGRVSGEVTDESYEVRLNGQPIHASNALTNHSHHDVLAFFQEQCNSNGAGLADELSHLDGTLKKFSSAPGIPGYLAMRREESDRGFVFCMASDHKVEESELLHRVKQMSQGDFGKLGDMRYISVRKAGTGSSVVAAWTHGVFDVKAMFPATGDAPGEDFANLPRPDGSRRILSGTVKGAPFGVNSYALAGTPEGALAEVDTKFQAIGYKPVNMPKQLEGRAGHFYTLGDAVDVGVTAVVGEQGLTNVSYVVSRGLSTVRR